VEEKGTMIINFLAKRGRKEHHGYKFLGQPWKKMAPWLQISWPTVEEKGTMVINFLANRRRKGHHGYKFLGQP